MKALVFALVSCLSLAAYAADTPDAGKQQPQTFEKQVTVKLDPGVSIEGIVLDEDGKPVAGASVTIETVGGDDPGPGGWIPVGGRDFEAGSNGRFAAKGLAPKEADVKAQAFRGPDKNRWATASPVRVKPPVSGLRLVLVAQGTASIRLLMPDGRPYA